MKLKLAILSMTGLVACSCWSMGSTNARHLDTEPIGKPAAASATPPKGKAAPSPTPTMASSGDFIKNLPSGMVRPGDDAGQLLLREYGAVFVARGGATPPTKVVFADAADVNAFQNSVKHATASVGGFTVDLQTAAFDALNTAIGEARRSGLSISPRGADSARRSYQQTVTLWASRVNPGLTYWVGKGRISAADAARIRKLSPFEQVPEILRLEENGTYFAKSLDKSIIYSVAPPGTSQHLSMLALDVKEFDNAAVRAVLAQHGWFQTVTSDLPHFTYLGVPESDLPSLGLKKVEHSGRVFWVPDI